MKNSILFIVLILTLTFFGCSKDEKKYGVALKELKFKSFEEARNLIGNYADFLEFYSSGVSTTSKFSFYHDVKDKNEEINEKTPIIRTNHCEMSSFSALPDFSQIDIGVFYINDLAMKYDNIQKKYMPMIESQLCNELSNLYGTTNSIKLIEHNGNVVFDEEFYFPEQFTKFEQGNKKDERNRPLIKDNLQVSWNKDSKNTNGVLFWLEWDGYIEGEEVISRQEKNEPIERLIWTPEDLGEATLDSKFLRGIPKGAVFTLSVYRGAGKNIQATLSNGEVKNFNLHNRIYTLWQYKKI